MKKHNQKKINEQIRTNHAEEMLSNQVAALKLYQKSKVIADQGIEFIDAEKSARK
jgi:hypothetical protein